MNEKAEEEEEGIKEQARRRFFCRRSCCRSDPRATSGWYQSLSGRMADKGKEPATEGVRSFETLWENQNSILRQLEVLSTEVQRISMEMRREFNPRQPRDIPHQAPREDGPVLAQTFRRGVGQERQWRRNTQPTLEMSDSDDELQMSRHVLLQEELLPIRSKGYVKNGKITRQSSVLSIRSLCCASSIRKCHGVRTNVMIL
ncbi:hypothetical protein M5K25_019418 [Dendrobium thyrsiflorum]|uniref:Uncharacterized protein n=1 Tax=Dendrobium thyrsiflorum TaxID=117978 RepID=A0ABD0ULN9_DENTH